MEKKKVEVKAEKKEKRLASPTKEIGAKKAKVEIEAEGEDKEEKCDVVITEGSSSSRRSSRLKKV